MKKYIIPFVANLTILAILIAVVIALTDATAPECSDFEKAVFQLADEAETFQLTPEFSEHGWSEDGPSGDWMQRWVEVAEADNALHLEFAQK